jgi:chemotaxis protein CheD
VTDERIPVRVGEAKVATGNHVLFVIGLGSCVGIALYDSSTHVGGLAHVMLPHPSNARKPSPPGRFASTAVEFLIGEMEQAGAARDRLYARMVGGASMFEDILADDGPALGTRNVDAARAALVEAGIPLKGEMVGGRHGRTINFYMQDGRILVTSVNHADAEL